MMSMGEFVKICKQTKISQTTALAEKTEYDPFSSQSFRTRRKVHTTAAGYLHERSEPEKNINNMCLPEVCPQTCVLELWYKTTLT